MVVNVVHQLPFISQDIDVKTRGLNTKRPVTLATRGLARRPRAFCTAPHPFVPTSASISFPWALPMGVVSRVSARSDDRLFCARGRTLHDGLGFGASAPLRHTPVTTRGLFLARSTVPRCTPLPRAPNRPTDEALFGAMLEDPSEQGHGAHACGIAKETLSALPTRTRALTAHHARFLIDDMSRPCPAQSLFPFSRVCFRCPRLI